MNNTINNLYSQIAEVTGDTVKIETAMGVVWVYGSEETCTIALGLIDTKNARDIDLFYCFSVDTHCLTYRIQ